MLKIFILGLSLVSLSSFGAGKSKRVSQQVEEATTEQNTQPVITRQQFKTIAVNGQEQDCTYVAINDHITVDFTSSDPLYFQVTMKQGTESYTIIGRQLTNKVQDLSVVAKESAIYCFEWQNEQQVAVRLATKIVGKLLNKAE